MEKYAITCECATAVAATATTAAAHYFLMRHANEINIIIGIEQHSVYRALRPATNTYTNLSIFTSFTASLRACTAARWSRLSATTLVRSLSAHCIRSFVCIRLSIAQRRYKTKNCGVRANNYVAPISHNERKFSSSILRHVRDSLALVRWSFVSHTNWPSTRTVYLLCMRITMNCLSLRICSNRRAIGDFVFVGGKNWFED